MNDSRRRLPNMNSVLDHSGLEGLPRHLCKHEARLLIAELRASMPTSEVAPSIDDVVEVVAHRVAQLLAGRHRAVINATGVVLHTNLGRAPWPAPARDAAARAMGYGNVEIDLKSGSRGGRLSGISRVMNRLTGSEDAIVVNNCAAAVLLALTAHAREREVIVSRGELVEIGGSFRVPDVIASGGARLREVGTTNRTKLQDYADAIHEDTAALLKVHRSNFRLVGFTEEPSMRELAKLAEARSVRSIYDLGSGALDGWGDEPSVREAIGSNASLVIFSGDKLLGGPQAGIIAGHRDAVQICRKHPLYRALRVDKVTLAALEATLLMHLRGEQPPALEMLEATPEDLRARAQALAEGLRQDVSDPQIVATESRAGGGSLPGEGLPSLGVRFMVENVMAVHEQMRVGEPSIVARIHEGGIMLDVRTVLDSEVDALVDGVRRAIHEVDSRVARDRG